MKRIPAFFLALLLCLAIILPAAGIAETKSIFLPDYMVETYNETVPTFWKRFLGSDIPENYRKEFTVSFVSEEDGKITYKNEENTVLITFTAPDRNSMATEVYFWNSLSNEIRNLPQLVFGWAAVANGLEGSEKVDGKDLMDWLNENVEDGDSRDYGTFFAVRNEEAFVFSSFTLTPSK